MNVVSINRCDNTTCTRRTNSATGYCCERCRIAMLSGDSRTPLDGVRVGQDTYRRVLEVAAEYGATVVDVVVLLIEEEFGAP